MTLQLVKDSKALRRINNWDEFYEFVSENFQYIPEISLPHIDHLPEKDRLKKIQVALDIFISYNTNKIESDIIKKFYAYG